MPGEKPLIDIIGCNHIVFAEKDRNGRVQEDRFFLDAVLDEVKTRVEPGGSIAWEINPLSLWQCRVFSRLLAGKPADLPLPKNISRELKDDLARTVKRFSEMTPEEINLKLPSDALFSVRFMEGLANSGIKFHPVDSLMRATHIVRHYGNELFLKLESERHSMVNAIDEKFMAKKIARLATGHEEVRLAVAGATHVQNISAELEGLGFRTNIHVLERGGRHREELEKIWLKRYVARQKNQWRKIQRRKKVFLMRFEGKLRKPALPKPRG